MSYTVLYRKLRPVRFGGVVGQEHIVTTLKNQIISGRVSHAYLFCGTRGTGKTSTAKIFAKAINCQNVENGEPCNECPSCLSINSGRSMNVIEIDAASNNGVDNIRDIREDVKYTPAEGKYKVYIIDEVHMLSTGAFNALLKTLEEPPEHVIFILATTDPQKIPPTIHSRCQRYDFKRISSKDMSDAIKGYMRGENVQIADNALEYISHISDGAMRDALSIIDQLCAFYYGEEITLDKVLELTGGADTAVLFELSAALCERQTADCMDIIKNLVADGRDLNRLVSELLEHFRDMLVAISITGTTTALDYSADFVEKLRTHAGMIGKETLIYYIGAFSEIQSAVKYSPNPRVLLETTCIKICNPHTDDSVGSLFDRIKALEDKISGSAIGGQAYNNGRVDPAPTGELKKPPKPTDIENPDTVGVGSARPKSKEDEKQSDRKPTPTIKKTAGATGGVDSAIARWTNFILHFKSKNSSGFVKTLIDKSTPARLTDNTLYIVTPDNVYDMRTVGNGENLILQQAKEFFGEGFELQFINESEYDRRHLAAFGKAPEKSYDFEDKINMKIKFVE